MMFRDMLIHCVSETLLQVTGCCGGVSCTHIPASVSKFDSQPGLGLDYLAATHLER